MKIFFCGDVMPGGVLPYQDGYIDKDLLLYMQGFDLRIGTLECAIGSNLPPAPGKLKKNGGNDNVCYARDEDFCRVVEMGFSALSLGNNHSFDLGEDGLRNTIEHLRDSGIGYFGAGMNLSEASKPFVVSRGGRSICFIGCCIKGCAPRSLIVATDDSYGVYQPSIEDLEKQIRDLKGKYDFIIIMPHWGEEHVRIPPPENVSYARRMIDAGADAVLGSHSHCVSPIITYKGKIICFSMGNFLDPDKCLTPPRPFYYPKNKEELKSLPKCINYPWSVKQPMLCVCGSDSRMGWVIVSKFSTDMETTYRLVRIGQDNIIRLYAFYSSFKDYLLRCLILPFLGQMTRLGKCYRLIYKIGFLYERKVRNLGSFRKNI